MSSYLANSDLAAEFYIPSYFDSGIAGIEG
jgi:hypothetical protein